MKRALITTLLLGLVGCGTNPSSTSSTPTPPVTPPPPVAAPYRISWDDGDPGKPVCAIPSADCKAYFVVHDKTTGDVWDVPIGTTFYVAATDLDEYEVRTDGYDDQGQPISSPWKPVPPAQ